MKIVEESSMPNGMRVVTLTMPDAKIVQAGICFDMGSMHDFLGALPSSDPQSELQEIFAKGVCALTPHRNGLAHFSEHLFAHALPQHAALEWLDKCVQNGLSLQLTTSFDTTDYSGGYGFKNEVKQFLEECATAISALDYSSDAVEIERGRIISEMNHVWSNPPTLNGLESIKIRYGEDTPMAQKFGGVEETLRSITEEQIREYHQNLHQGKKATLILVGDITHDEARQWAEKFAFMPEGTPTVHIPVSVKKGFSGHYEPIGHQGDVTHSTLTFHAPQDLFVSKNLFSLHEILIDFLKNNVLKKIGEEKQVYNIDTAQIMPSQSEGFGFNVFISEHKDKIGDIIFEVVDKISNLFEQVTEDEFNKIKKRLYLKNAANEANAGMNIGNLYNKLRDHRHTGYHQDLLNATAGLERVNFEDFSAFLRQYQSAILSVVYAGLVSNSYPEVEALQKAFDEKFTTKQQNNLYHSP